MSLFRDYSIRVHTYSYTLSSPSYPQNQHIVIRFENSDFVINQRSNKLWDKDFFIPIKDTTDLDKKMLFFESYSREPFTMETFVGNNFYNLKELLDKKTIEEEIPISRNSVVAGVLKVTFQLETPLTIYHAPENPTDPVGFYLTIKHGETMSLLPQTGRQITYFRVQFQNNAVRTHDDVIGGTNPEYNDKFYFPIDTIDYEQDYILFQFLSSNIIGETELGRSYLYLTPYKDGNMNENVALDVYYMNSVMRGVFYIDIQIIYPDSIRDIKETVEEEEVRPEPPNPRELLDKEKTIKSNAKGLRFHEPLSLFNSFNIPISYKLLHELENVRVLNDNTFVQIYNNVSNEKEGISQKYLDVQIYNECYHCHKTFFVSPATPSYDCKYCNKPQKTPTHPAPQLLGQLIPIDDIETVCRQLLEEYFMLFDHEGERVLSYDECKAIYENLNIDTPENIEFYWSTFLPSNDEEFVNMQPFIDFLIKRTFDLGYGKILPRYISLLRNEIAKQKDSYATWTCPHDFHINDMVGDERCSVCGHLNPFPQESALEIYEGYQDYPNGRKARKLVRMEVRRTGSILSGTFCLKSKVIDDYSTPSTVDGYINSLGYIHINLTGVPEDLCYYVGKLCFKQIVLAGKNPCEEHVNCYLKKVSN